MNNKLSTAGITGFRGSEESEDTLEDSMFDEYSVIPLFRFDQEEKEKEGDEQGEIILDELEGMKSHEKIVFKEIGEGETSGDNILLDPSETERMDLMFQRSKSNKLIYYTKCVLYLMQKYVSLTSRQMASLIGNLDSKHLYDILNVLCEYKILIQGGKEEKYLFRLCTKMAVLEPIISFSNLESEIQRIEREIMSIQDLINDLP